MLNKKSFSFMISVLLTLEFMLVLVGPAYATPASITEPTEAKPSSMLQYTAGGHILGFDLNKVYLAGLDHALTVEFVDGQGNAPIGVAATKSSAAGSAPALGQVTYENIWQGVNIIYTSTKTGLVESTYVVQPGGNPADIRLKYNTPVELLKNGMLSFAFETGTLTESMPIAFQEIDGKRVQVEVRFTLDNNHVGFAVGIYNPDYPLTIDPTYAWHTFYGSAGTDEANAITRDGNGNVYVAGSSDMTWSGPNEAAPLHPYTGGQYTTNIVVVKLNNVGAYQWHTFYGSGSDFSGSIASDVSGNVYVTGYSWESWNGPQEFPPLYAHSGGRDIVIIKLNSAGTYLWHTFYGSSAQDYGYAITRDENNNIYVAGHSDTTWNGPWGALPLFGSPGGIVIIKLNSAGTYQWHTFYGTDDNDWGRSIVSDGSGNVYVTGYSLAGWNGPWGLSPLHAHSGGQDIVVLKLNGAGAYQWHTFYGSSGADYGYAITSDGNGNVYVAGDSDAAWYGPNYESPLNYYKGLSDIVVIKLNSAGTYQWHTFYGSPSADYGSAITSDGSGNVYVTGESWATWKGPNSALPLNNYTDYNDIIVVKLNSTGKYQWHAFYGSDSDRGTAVTSDGNGDIYVAGYSNASWNGTNFATPLHVHVGEADDIVVLKLLANDEQDTTCGYAPPITLGFNHMDVLYAPTDIDPYKFEVPNPYTTIEAVLTPPIMLEWAKGDFALSLFKSCDGSGGQPWDIGRMAIHIGRMAIHIGGGEEINVRFNVGKTTGTYYLTVQVPENGSYSGLPYQLSVDLQPPNFTMVDTLILYNPTRFKTAYGLDAASQTMDELTRLAKHSSVNGIIIQLDQSQSVTAAYTNWDNATVVNGNENSYTNNVTAANFVSDNIRMAMLEYMAYTGQYITDNGYVVIVGDDDQIPYRRLGIQPPLIGDGNWSSERDYFLQLGDTVNTPIDAAMMADRTLSDNFYGDYQDQGIGYFPSLAVGRLSDTPVRIQNMIESFLQHNGVIDLSAPKGKAAIAGYTFLADSAQQMCTYLQANSGLTTDCTLIDTAVNPNKFTPAQLSQKFIGDAPNVAAFYGHTNHTQMLTPTLLPLNANDIKLASFDPLSSLWWTVGCQSGLVLPKSEHFPLSLTQALGDHNVTYLGNTGWAWGSDGPLTYSELLYQLVANKLRTNQGGVGDALRLAKQEYFIKTISNAYGQGKNYTFSHYDYKVVTEATLYGLPMLKFNFPGTAPVQSASSPQVTMGKTEVRSLALPANFHDFPFSLGNLTQIPQQYNGNTYYIDGEKGAYSVSSKSPFLPQSEYINFATSLGQAEGVIWKGGPYIIVQGNNPLVLNPTQLNASPAAEPSFNGTYPLLPVALAGLEKLDGTFTNLITFQTGQYIGNETNGILRLFSNMEFLVGLWNGTSSDETPPALGQLATSTVNNTLHIAIPIDDVSGVYKAYVTYTERSDQANSGLWQSKELTGAGECTAGQHTYSLDLPLKAETEFFIQVMDCAGNVSVQFNNGKYYVVDTPFVYNIVRTGPSLNNLASVGFTVTFTESVTGVDISDFNLTTSDVSGAAISGFSGSGGTYTVTVNTGSGNGTIRLDVMDDDSIKDASLYPLGGAGAGNGNFTIGEIYTIVKSATFGDVPLAYWAWQYIERLYNAGITGGCSVTPLNYCPDSTVTRAQMAVFLLKGMHGSNYTPPTVGASTGFTDVPVGYWADKWIKQLAVEGITGGCGSGNYCPDTTVTRAQMAVFLLKAKHGSSYSPPAATGVFTDVPVGYWARNWIEQLAAEGITGGCSTGVYCPDSSVTRAQMAVFLVKAFNLP